MTPEVQSILETLEEVSTEPVDWRIICDQADRRLFKGAILALITELALCVAGYLILHGWGLL